MFSRMMVLVAFLLAAVPAGAGVVRSSTNVSGGSGGTYTGGTITSPILAPAADNCANVPYSFTGDTNTGMCSPAADELTLYAGGSNNSLHLYSGGMRWGGSSYPLRGSVTGGWVLTNYTLGKILLNDTYLRLASDTHVEWVNGTNTESDTTDLKLSRDAAHRLALRDSNNPNQFHWYHTDTGGNDTNYQRGTLKTSATGIEIAAETAGSGADNLDITLTPAGTGLVYVGASGIRSGTNYPWKASVTGGWQLTNYSVGKILLMDAYQRLASDVRLSWIDGTDTESGSPDISLVREAAGVVGVRDATTGGAAIGFVEQTAPAAPAEHGARLYAKDNGAGKTQLCVLFATGAEQCFATEP